MFGFGIKDKAKKILENQIGIFEPTSSWLNSIVTQGKQQDYNEYDVAIWYCITEWKFEIDNAINTNFNRGYYYTQIKAQMENLKEIEKSAHQDTGYELEIKKISEKLEELKD